MTAPEDFRPRPNGSDAPAEAMTRRGNKAKTIDEAKEALGIDWMSKWDDLTDAIPPDFTQFVGEQLLERLKAVA